MIGAEMMPDTLDPRVLTCLGHIVVDSVASVLAVYVPSEERKFSGALKLARWSRYWRHTTEAMYTVWRVVGISAGIVIFEEVHYRFQLEWTELVAVATVLSTMQILHAVAFLTALFEIDMPLRVGDELVVHHSVHRVPGDWRPKPARLYVIEPNMVDVGFMKRGRVHIKRDDAVKGTVYVGNARGDLEKCGKIRRMEDMLPNERGYHECGDSLASK